MTATKPLLTLWSKAAFEACADFLDEAERLVVASVNEIASHGSGNFSKTTAAQDGPLLHCEGREAPDAWRVFVRLADSHPENNKFAYFSEIKEYLSGSAQSQEPG